MAENLLNISPRWFSSKGYIYHRQEVADAPCKDYFQLIVWPDLSVTFKVWKLQPPFKASPQLAPIAYHSTYEHFKTDLNIRDAIQSRLRGELEFLDNLLEGRFNFFERLDKNLQLHIISFLDVCSVLRLSATSRYFHQLCENDSIWKRHFMSGILPYYVTPGLMDIVDQQGWKAFYIIIQRIAMSTGETGTRYLLQKAPSDFLDNTELSRRGSARNSPGNLSTTSL